MQFTIGGEHAGLFLMLLSIFMISLVALCVKLIPSFNVAETIYYRALVGFTLTYIFIKHQNIHIYISNFKEMFLVFLNSLMMFIS